ncbi:MAG TPA: Wzz/FepE/Etk N-terminal domain-containing protein [Steroidobacteraceae bacterium]|jgi:uncharacterized protein involved in exopolysaccharide biosynthesis|nr:Wzz/FepE/Etk N-terminal domain-containing protein [Steroidobacteraceae bacterium]
MNLRDLVAQMLRRRLLIAAMVVFFVALAVAAAVLLPRNYKAAVVLMPAPDLANGSGDDSLRGSVSGLIAAAGLGAGGNDRSAESLAVLQSEALTRNFIESNNLLPVLYADRWDAQTKRWKVSDARDVPTIWEADQFFHKDVYSVTRDTVTGLVTLTVKWKDPKIAAQWANGLVALTNQYLRDKAIARSERHLAYLNEQAARTSVVEVRQAIFGLLEDELKQIMVARGSDEYAFRVIDPATAPELPSNLPPWLLVVIGILAGLMLGIFATLVELAWSGPP